MKEKLKDRPDEKTNMYANAKTWNPFKGCNFDCSYCRPTFKKQAKRQQHNCRSCYNFEPHTHPERLNKIPSADIVFVAGNGDISFCPPKFTRQIIAAIKKHNIRCPYKTYYFQSKRPEYFEQFLAALPENVILVTTLETNRDEGYSSVSKAPIPIQRYKQFLALDYPRKVITAEPIMDFDTDVYSQWMINLQPEYIWLGFNSRPKQVQIPEPSTEKVIELIRILKVAGIEIKGKTLRGIRLGK